MDTDTDIMRVNRLSYDRFVDFHAVNRDTAACSDQEQRRI